MRFTLLFLLVLITPPKCYGAEKTPIPGAYQTELYCDMIEGKVVAVVANQTSMVGQTHLVDINRD
jgi:hypothetical protein